MNAIALVKHVPDTAQLSSAMDGLRLMAEGPRIINPWDEYAVEECLRLKEAHGGQVTLLSQGPPAAAEALKRGLAMGADQAVLLSDESFEGGDTLATARILAAAITRLEDWDIVLAGRSALDGDTAQTAIQVAALLEVPQLTYVARIREVDFAARTITVERMLEGGREVLTSKLPCVVSVVKEINEPRYPSFISIRKAAKATIPVWTAADLGLDPAAVGAAASGVDWSEISLPPAREGECEMIAGETPEAIAAALVDRLMAEKVI
ncbi:MAG: electron transfer flavoprotein subunit beta/FixA family protein [Anaerolineae bacterium]